jgi:hypothetical protein
VFFFLKLMGNVKVAVVLAASLILFAALGASPQIGVVPGQMGWWDWTYFAIGVLMFLSLGAMVLSYFFEPDLILCGEPGVIPVWAEFLGMCSVAAPTPVVEPLAASAPLYHKPKERLYPLNCSNCGAGSEVPFIGSPCPFCGEVPPAAAKKRSAFKWGANKD